MDLEGHERSEEVLRIRLGHESEELAAVELVLTAGIAINDLVEEVDVVEEFLGQIE